MSSENTQRAENPPSSTSVPLFDTPSPNTFHKVFTYLVDSINLLTERSDVLIRKIDMLNNDSVQIKSQLKRIQEHLGITTAEPYATPPELVVAFVPPSDTSAPRRLDPSSSDTAATSSASDATGSENRSGLDLPVAAP